MSNHARSDLSVQHFHQEEWLVSLQTGRTNLYFVVLSVGIAGKQHSQ